jgi:hypothetical protein
LSVLSRSGIAGPSIPNGAVGDVRTRGKPLKALLVENLGRAREGREQTSEE